jgi:ABC-2 type transport system permease protein
MKQTLAITRKELAGYFGSPMALIFVGAFLAVTLFAFFWVEAFFARGVADVRPLFRWMPVLLIFLVAALTMRQWSEEQRSGTMEVLLTLPVSSLQLVLGKFLAVMALVAVSLGLTIFLPITVAILGNLDGGPVVGGYLAALLLAAAYAAIGLFISSRTDNQIVALISTALLGGLLYLAGSAALTNFVGEGLGEVLRAIGSGSRFESIQRGVVDLRDLAYYLTLAGIFLALNVASLDSKRWGRGRRTLPHRRGVLLTTSLVLVNLIVLNVWLAPLPTLRLDLTAQHEYSLSQTTRDLLANLQEPLVIRGYFSEKTHPLLAPLVPQIRDLLEEYRIASNGKLQLEVVDPTKDPDVEAEANQVYGIHSLPFQVAGRYEQSIISSYFDILIRYGDQSVVLTYSDLVEVDPGQDGSVEVRLRNLEYDLTRSIKKVVYGFQSVATVLAALDKPAELTLYVTPNSLPQSLADAPATVAKVAQEITAESGAHFTYQEIDPDAPGSPLTRQQLYDQYGLQPLVASLVTGESYYLHMVLKVGDKVEVIYPSGTMGEADVRTAIEAALKRASSGFLKVVGLWTPPQQPTQNIFGQTQQPISDWQQLRQALGEEYEVRDIDLASGRVPEDVDVLVLIAPQGLADADLFAIDQYLMRGGSVIVAAGNYAIAPDPYGTGVVLQPLSGGLRDLLASYGIHVGPELVLDPQNEPFPVYVTRNVGGVTVREVQALSYPPFVDVRRDGMAADSPIVANLPAVTLNWTSPITLDEALKTSAQVTTLLRSTRQSATTYSTEIQPDFQLYPDLGFPRGPGSGEQILAVAVQGRLPSAFQGKPIPLPTGGEGAGQALTPLDYSPETARLVVIGSAEFVDDLVFQVSASLSGNRYQNSLKLVQNAVSWATEDTDLLSIRSRGTSVRVLQPMSEGEQSAWEVGNYAVALVALGAVGVVWNVRRRREKPLPLRLPKAEQPAEEVER